MPTRRTPAPGATLLLLAIAVTPAASSVTGSARMFVRPTPVPVERLVTNLEKALRAEPQDHLLHYDLARVHFLALSNLTFDVPAYTRGNEPGRPAPPHLAAGFVENLRFEEALRRARKQLGIGENDSDVPRETTRKLYELARDIRKELDKDDWRPPAPDRTTLVRHLMQAFAHFDRAIELAPDNALYELGRASLSEVCLDHVSTGKLPPLDQMRQDEDESTEKKDATDKPPRVQDLTTLTRFVVRDRYLAAYRAAIGKDLELDRLPLAGLSELVSWEAGNAYLRVCKEDESLTQLHEERIADVEAKLARIKKIPRGAITPILIGGEGQGLDDLLSPGATTDFDLDGLGIGTRWPWVRRTTRILVWDPCDQRDIRSGRQLFGSVSFSLFHRDGYAALGLLDDDGDGRLSGLELLGLSVWTDHDGDGRSDGTEVLPVWELGIDAVSTTASQGPDGILTATVTVGGTELPTFDWVASPVNVPDPPR